MSNPQHPKPGDLVMDLSDIEVVDITPEHVARLSKLREGHALAILAVLLAEPAARQRAGLSEVEVAELATLSQNLQRVEEVLPAVEKLRELLHETRLVWSHEIAYRLGEMAHQVRRRAERAVNGVEVAAPFEALIDYHFETGQKSAAAREKNKTEAEAPASSSSPA
ncbi:hypothetical protein [Polyangium spumosum]|uniref:Uncharacterized protein n=1 Tax=Polyangium spumosum TaxID=889282 RepID=A0A6N7PP86_9BACT|nr:hypothetical protein [Polyangium spumosum]MRG93843.1 hypothetical protein [Polyangium spumosum]